MFHNSVMATLLRNTRGRHKANLAVITIRARLVPTAQNRSLLKETALAYLTACRHVQALVRKTKVLNRYLLHLLVYRDLVTPPDNATPLDSAVATPLPSQLAIRACLRVTNQVQCKKKRKPNPYPHRSFDVDSKSLAYDASLQLVRLTTLLSIGQRGVQAKQARLRVPIQFENQVDRLAFESSIFVGGSLVFPRDPSEPLVLVAKLLAPPPKRSKALNKNPQRSNSDLLLQAPSKSNSAVQVSGTASCPSAAPTRGEG